MIDAQTPGQQAATRKSLAEPLIWLGGRESGRSDRYGRPAYAVTGTVVAGLAVLSGTVVGFAGAAAHWSPVVVGIAALVSAVLIAAIARATAAGPVGAETIPEPTHADHRVGGSAIRPGRRRTDRFGRSAVAVLTGAIVAELASTLLFGGPVNRALDDHARRAADSAATVVSARSALDQSRTARAALERTLTQARGDIDEALIVARCEYHPTPECPQTKITGIPGRGPETRAADEVLSAARGRMDTALARVEPLDRQLSDRQAALDRARSAAVGAGDRGLGARWQAMHDYTTTHSGALLLRLAVLAIAVFAALLPRLLRPRRDATIALLPDRIQAGPEKPYRKTESVALTSAASTATTTAVAHLRQRPRVLAAIGNLEIGVADPQGPVVADHAAQAELPVLPALPPAEPSTAQQGGPVATATLAAVPATMVPNPPTAHTRPELPAARTSLGRTPPPDVAPKQHAGLELPLLGTVPFTDTAVQLIGPLLPKFVTGALDRAVENATAPLRTFARAFEEAEEITFTLRRTRTITVHAQEYPAPDGSPHLERAVPAEPKFAGHYPTAATIYRHPLKNHPALPRLGGSWPMPPRGATRPPGVR